MARISFNLSSNYMQMAIYRSCACLELNKLKSPLKCRRAVRIHHHMTIAGEILMAGDWHWLSMTDCSLGLMGLKTPTLLVPLRQASFCVKDAARCVCDAVFLSCGRGCAAKLSWRSKPGEYIIYTIMVLLNELLMNMIFCLLLISMLNENFALTAGTM